MKKSQIEQVEVEAMKFIGVGIPISLHKELRMEAAREGTSGSQLLQKAIIYYLNLMKRRNG
ncbi:MAG: hypothetical protein ABSG44_09305 [Thermodesulfobacteriota bacterium]|jgi:hypothetical protein